MADIAALSGPARGGKSVRKPHIGGGRRRIKSQTSRASQRGKKRK